MRRIGREGVAIVPGSREVVRARETHYRFRQDSDFKYLSGFVEPDAVLVIAPGRKADGHAAEFVMFVRARDTDMAIWHGRRARPEGAVPAYGADEALPIDEFATELPHLLAERKHVHYTLGADPPQIGRTSCRERAFA